MRFATLVLSVVLALQGLAYAQATVQEGAGLEVRVELEASLASVKKLHSDEWRRYAQWIPLIGFIFGLFGPTTEVFEHSKDISGAFLGQDASGKLTVIEVRRGGSEFRPGVARITVRGSTLVLAFHDPEPRGYRVSAVPGESTGVFAGVEVGGHLRVVGLHERFSIVRGELVIGWASRQRAEAALSFAGWDESAVREALSRARPSVVPFPPSDPANPPEKSVVRIVRFGGSEGSVRLSVAVLVGTDAMPVMEGGQRAREVRLRVVAAEPSGTRVLHDGPVPAGGQVTASGEVGLPAVLMVVAGPRTLVQIPIAGEEER